MISYFRKSSVDMYRHVGKFLHGAKSYSRNNCSHCTLQYLECRQIITVHVCSNCLSFSVFSLGEAAASVKHRAPPELKLQFLSATTRTQNFSAIRNVINLLCSIPAAYKLRFLRFSGQIAFCSCYNIFLN